MFDVYLIEVRGQTAGVATRDGQAFRFHASQPAFASLDGQTFVDAAHAERAARRLVLEQERRRAARAPALAAE